MGLRISSPEMVAAHLDFVLAHRGASKSLGGKDRFRDKR
jgi:hypothetical protein